MIFCYLNCSRIIAEGEVGVMQCLTIASIVLLNACWGL